MSPPRPTDLVLHQASHLLEVAFDDGQRFRLPCEYLRVESPSAEVQGHGPGQKVLVAGKRHVNIKAIEPMGNYGVLLRFDDDGGRTFGSETPPAHVGATASSRYVTVGVGVVFPAWSRTAYVAV